jgi:hypothetical protein
MGADYYVPKPYHASAAALRRSAKPMFLDLSISILYARGERLPAQRVDGFRSALATPYSSTWTRPRLKSSRACRGGLLLKVVGALERRGYDIRGKMTAPISRVPRRAPPKSKSDPSARFMSMSRKTRSIFLGGTLYCRRPTTPPQTRGFPAPSRFDRAAILRYAQWVWRDAGLAMTGRSQIANCRSCERLRKNRPLDLCDG